MRPRSPAGRSNEAHLARQVGDDGVAALERDDQAIERFTEVAADVTSQLVGVFESPVEDRENRAPRSRDSLL